MTESAGQHSISTDCDASILTYELLSDFASASLKIEDFDKEVETRARSQYPEISNIVLQRSLALLAWLDELKVDHPYSLLLFLAESACYLQLSYPDLAAGAAYKALLLSDAVREESDEYHESAVDSLRLTLQRREPRKDVEELSNALILDYLTDKHQPQIYYFLSITLLQCGCFKSAHQFVSQGLAVCSESVELQRLRTDIEAAATAHLSLSGLSLRDESPAEWTDDGHVRRERYPWNHHEPQRLEEVDELNSMMSKVAPKLEVKAIALPNLVASVADVPEVVQLGVFAKVDLEPGETILNETSLLTANNKLQDALCDACNADLPDVRNNNNTEVVACNDCEVVFCSQQCHDQAQELYHPALCEQDIEAIAKDVPPEQAANSLYALLLLRGLAMAETQARHPLELDEVRYIWGDFNDSNASTIFDQTVNSGKSMPVTEAFPTTLPFSFEYNIRLPFHMLEKMDIDIFVNPQYDVWVFNTLYAKFRGTASARLSGLGGRAIRGPEVCAVHPMWCLANHSCDPNVSWNWGGSIAFKVREERVKWHGRGEERVVRSNAGVRKGEEILNHYCDLDLPVNERRAWARGALGGDCICARCVWESEQGH